MDYCVVGTPSSTLGDEIAARPKKRAKLLESKPSNVSCCCTDCHGWNNFRWKEERFDPSLRQEDGDSQAFWEGKMPSWQRWRDYQTLNANGVFMAFRLATDEHLHVLPETMLWMLKAKLQAMKREQENSGRNVEKCVSRWIGK